MAGVKVYGADWCSLTQDALEFLARLGVEYEYIDIEQDLQAREWVKQQNDGKEKKPTIQIGDRILSEPSDEELEEVLTASGKL
jgi:mycoredoxin